MTLENLVTVAVRLLAIAIAILVLRSVVMYGPEYYKLGLRSPAYAYFSLMVLLALTSLYLWLFPLSVTNKLLSFKKQKIMEPQPANYAQIQIVAFTVLGLYLLFYAISDLSYWATILFFSFQEPVRLTIEHKGQIAATVVELIIAIYLLLGTNGIMKLLRRIQSDK